MYTLISFASCWGSKYGGINSFNTEFLSAFGFAYNQSAQIICVVSSAKSDEIDAARKTNVSLIPLLYPPKDNVFTEAQAQAGIDELNRQNIRFEPSKTIWIGHDRITGAAANEAAKLSGSRSALIHHMSYDLYESYAEDSQTAKEKIQEQSALFQQANFVFAVGPLLRDSLKDMLRGSKNVHMLIPGLSEIKTCSAPIFFTAFMSGRLGDGTARIKQGHLGIAAFSRAIYEARDYGMPEGLINNPKMIVRGVDYENPVINPSSELQTEPEKELKEFATIYAKRVINLQALTYTLDQKVLFDELSGASVALMPSWHEGFGLVAWEAIAAGVPLIISENSGVYRLLREDYPGAGPGCVYPIDVAATNEYPFFQEDDLKSIVNALKKIADKPEVARQQAGILRNLLVGKYTWHACAEHSALIFEWSMQKGSIPQQEQIVTAINPPSSAETSTNFTISLINMPSKQWKVSSGMAGSQLLRAEESVVPFDSARLPEIDKLNLWLDDPKWPLAVRLVTGAGGLGKTRLALELCRQRLESGWHSGFLDSEIDPRDILSAWKTISNINKSVLIIVDYAETRQDSLLVLIKSILDNPGEHPVRLLLLARAAGEWWVNLPSKDQFCEALLCGDATSGPHTLPPMHTTEQDRNQAFNKALESFSNAFGVSTPNIVPELEGDHFSRPLYLQMAALLALYGEQLTTADGLTRALLNHERRYWGRLLTNMPFAEAESYAQQLLAVTTLAGGFASVGTAKPYFIKANGNDLGNATFYSLMNTLIPLYPGKQGLQGVRPDILGEALVAHSLLLPNSTRLLDAVLSKSASKVIRRNSLTVIARMSVHRPELYETLVEALIRNLIFCYSEIVEVSKETISLLPTLVEAAFERLDPQVKSKVANLFEPLFMDESIELANFSCQVLKYLTNESKEQRIMKPNNLDCASEYALNLGNYSVMLSRTGNYLEAQASSLEGMTILEGLYHINEKRFLSFYAFSLYNYAIYIANTGDLKNAIVYSIKSLELRKKVIKNSDDCKKNYVSSLNSCGNQLTEYGELKISSGYLKESLNLSKQLSNINSKQFGPLLITSLDLYANYLRNIGDYDNSVKCYKIVKAKYGEYAKSEPDKFEPSYAKCLQLYGEVLLATGNYEEALVNIKLAKNIYIRIVRRNKSRFSFDLSCCLLIQDFINWLLNLNDSVNYPKDINTMSTMSSLFDQALMQMYLSFVEACRVSEQADRCTAFKKIISFGSSLQTISTTPAPYWFCAVAFLNTFEPDIVAKMNWQTDWLRFVNKYNGRIPQWMYEVSRRLGFKWPEYTGEL